MLALCRDGLLPSFFAQVNPKTKSPIRIILPLGLFMMLLAGLIPINDLAELSLIIHGVMRIIFLVFIF